MMHPIRLAITAVFGWLLADFLSAGAPEGDPLAGAVALAALLPLALVVAVLWAPVVGARVAEPITGQLVQDTSSAAGGRIIRCIVWLQSHALHPLALLLVLWEGANRPESPTPPLLGIRSVKPGSLLERWLAREIYRHNHVNNCLMAHRILVERHGVTPPTHPSPEVLLALQQAQRTPAPERPALPVPGRTPPPLTRNPSIRIGDVAPPLAEPDPVKPPSGKNATTPG